MTTENVEVIRRLFHAVEARDIEPMYEIYSPEVVIREAASLPYGATTGATPGSSSTAWATSRRGITSRTTTIDGWTPSSPMPGNASSCAGANGHTAATAHGWIYRW